jgi:hypothetical protein
MSQNSNYLTQKMFKTFKNEKNYFRIVHNSKKKLFFQIQVCWESSQWKSGYKQYYTLEEYPKVRKLQTIKLSG